MSVKVATFLSANKVSYLKKLGTKAWQTALFTSSTDTLTALVFIFLHNSILCFLVNSVWQHMQLVLYSIKIPKLMHDDWTLTFTEVFQHSPPQKRFFDPVLPPHLVLPRWSEGSLGSRGSCLAYGLIGHDFSGELGLSLLEAGIGLPVHAVDLL